MWCHQVVGSPIELLTGRHDPWFGLDLALRCEFRGEVIWAYNRRHLDVIERHIAAKLRPRQSTKPTSGDRWETEAGLERLPEWMPSAKNRPDILRCIANMRETKAALTVRP